jgi:hypothetical protein
MTKWEYKHETDCEDNQYRDRLAELGLEGWELVSVVRTLTTLTTYGSTLPYAGYTGPTYEQKTDHYYFKRPLKEQE